MMHKRTGDSLDISYDTILTWPTPNYDNPTRRTWIVPYACTLTAISTILVTIRIALRFARRGGGLGLDDVFLVLSFLFLIAYTAIVAYETEIGVMDRHVWDIRPELWVIGTELGWFTTICFSSGTGLLKLSILFFYRRLIKGTYNRTWLIATWLAVGFTVAYSFTFVLSIMFTCWPIEAFWKSVDPFWSASNEYHCYTFINGNILSGVCNAVSDLYSVILPALVLWDLQLPRRQKIGLFAIFTLGGIDVVLACIRTKYMWDFATLGDPSWYGYEGTAVSAAEWNIGMICACLPSLRVLFRTFFEDGSRMDEAKPRPYVKPRTLNRIPSAESELPFASCKGEPEWSTTHFEQVSARPKSILRVREYAVQ